MNPVITGWSATAALLSIEKTICERNGPVFGFARNVTNPGIRRISFVVEGEMDNAHR
jgi:hypothetical protein